MNNNEIIEFLESKGASREFINIILKNNNSDDYFDNIKKKYDLLYYAGLNTEQIEMYFSANTSLLKCDFNEFIKCAWIFDFINDTNFLFSARGYIRVLNEYKKMFMRYMIISKNNIKIDGPSVLLINSKLAYSGAKYTEFNDLITKMFGYKPDNDAELEFLLNQILIYDGKKASVDDIIETSSKRFYGEYLQDKIKKSKQGKTR